MPRRADQDHQWQTRPLPVPYGPRIFNQQLLAELTESTENTLWSAVRAIDENIMLLDHMAQHARQAEKFELAKMLARKAEESKQHADLLRKAAVTQAAVNTGQLDERD